MKTPMQELINKLKQLKYSEINEQAWDAYDSVMDIAEQLLEKEKDHAKYFAFKFRHESFTLKDIEKEYDAVFDYKDQEYYKTFKTKKK